jgi:Acyl-CoA dehydrogenase, C-terminal domain
MRRGKYESKVIAVHTFSNRPEIRKAVLHRTPEGGPGRVCGRASDVRYRRLPAGRHRRLRSVGMAQAALAIAVAYAKERHSFGKPILHHQAVGFRLADLTIDFSPGLMLACGVSGMV